ncbi:MULTISPECIES: AAA family ATPase [Bacillus cereus group]|uniref:AAA family ATPase n=1 Tax=Bacillus cereus group TaxID=86661 RepID=UPI0011C8CF72|nr:MULTISPECIES: AAA family ATPase [Bacillus cereus group]QWG76928.1 hypothetical protein EXW27_04480 [Bacillus mycoides]TXR77604.1 hypothetical protein DN408_19100 [Bacillus sp. AR13-1]
MIKINKYNLINEKLETGELVKSKLNSNNKCAYCETVFLDGDSLEVDHLKPKALYPDLFYDMSNLICACHSCSMSRGSRFPLSPNQEPLLLNPYIDDPETNFHYDKNGMIFSETEKGNVTISTFNLNRLDLLHRRYRQLEAFQENLKNNPGIYISDDVEFAGMKRYVAKNWKESDSSGEGHQINILDEEYFINVKKESLIFQENLEIYNLENKNEKTSNYYFKNRIIERVVIRNFKGISLLDISLPGYQEERAPWLMLLGENGTGKSTILKAISLALMGEETRKKLNLKPSKFIKTGAKYGYVSVQLSGSLKPITLRFFKNDEKFYGSKGFKDVKVLLLAYGSTRILSHNDDNVEEKEFTLRIENMFNPFVPINSVKKSFYTISDRDFAEMGELLKKLLMLGDEYNFIRKNQKVFLKSGRKSEVLIEDLSDGYQSMIALASDIIMVMKQYWDNIKEAEGIVLIDELDLHLHPQWKLKIVTQLRTVFPRIQFICTTHDPLCLRGLHNNEINVVKKLDEKVYLINRLPDLEGMKVDQILMADYFGLHSTYSEYFNNLYKRYYELVNKERTEAEEKEFTNLEGTINKSMVLGDTKRERILYSVIDSYIARESKELSNYDISPSLKNKLMDILDPTKGEYHD